MEPCPYTVGKCDVMRTCPHCKHVLSSRTAMHRHQRVCKEPLDVVFAQYQHDHHRLNHDPAVQQARRRLKGR